MQVAKIISVIVLPLSFLFFSACSDSGRSSGSGGNVGKLEANWLSDCVSITSGTKIYSEQYTSGTYSITTSYFSDTGCATPSLTVAETGNYSATPMDSAGDGNVDWTLGDFKLQPKTVSLSNHYNSIGYCGYNDWIVDVPKSILSRACGTIPAPVGGNTVYSIYQIGQTAGDPNHIGDLRYGISSSDRDGSSPSQRYNTYSPSLFLHTQ